MYKGFRRLFVVLVLASCWMARARVLWTPCSPYYIYRLHERHQGKLQYLMRDLLFDAEVKIKSVQQYREQYYKSLQYQLGDMMYQLRNFYKKLVREYQRCQQNIAYGHLDHYQNILTLVLVHRMSLEIETKVIMIQKWQRKRESKRDHQERMLAPLRSGTNQEYDELEDVPLREVQVRERMAQRAAASRRQLQPKPAARGPRRRAPSRRAPPLAVTLDLGENRKNKKWRHVRTDRF